MKKTAWIAGGVCAVVVGLVVLGSIGGNKPAERKSQANRDAERASAQRDREQRAESEQRAATARAVSDAAFEAIRRSFQDRSLVSWRWLDAWNDTTRSDEGWLVRQALTYSDAPYRATVLISLDAPHTVLAVRIVDGAGRVIGEGLPGGQ